MGVVDDAEYLGFEAYESDSINPFQFSHPFPALLPSAAEEFYFDGLVEFEFGPPGKLTINAGHGHSAFAVPAERLEFNSEAEYVDFVVRTFNAIPYYNKDGKFLGFYLDVEIVGSPFMSDYTGTNVVEVEDPLSTYLGGPDGFVSIAGITTCVAPSRCGGAGSGQQSNFAAVEGHETPLSSSISADPTPEIELPPFDITRLGAIRKDETLGGVVAIGQTKLSEKSIKPYETIWCGPPQVITFGGISHYAPTTCSTEVIFPNELIIGMTTFTMAFVDECRLETHNQSDPEASIPGAWHSSLSWAVNATVFRKELHFPQSGGYLSIDGMQTDHIGGLGKYPDFSKVVESRGWCVGTGCIQGDPCN